MLSVRQKEGPGMPLPATLVGDSSNLRGYTARFRNLVQRSGHVGREYYGPVAAPCAATTAQRCLAQNSQGPTSAVGSDQLSVGEEAYPATVRRPEGQHRVLCSIELLCGTRRECANPQATFAVPAHADE